MTVSRRQVLYAGSALAFKPLGARGAAGDRVVLALIGAGGRGSQLARNFVRVENCVFKHICDVNAERGESLARELESASAVRPSIVRDMRTVLGDRDVDGVVIATPEHWHALGTVWAVQAGKDVYVEKNVSLSIWEGRKMLEAARKYKRIVQCGTQNRSAPYGVTAREYLASGKLGRIVHVKVYNLLGGGQWKAEPDAPAPPGLDWDGFLGPAREVPFNPGRLKGWINYWDYCGGWFSGDATHQLDLARMAIGDPGHPRAVFCQGGRLAYDDGREVPDFQAITYDYGSFVMTCEAGTFTPYMRKFPDPVRYENTWPYWPGSSTRIEIYGTRQQMMLGQHGAGWQIMEADGKVVAQDKGYFPDKWHQPNFVDCIRSRKLPNGDIEQGHFSATLVHLANVAHRCGNRHLRFDAVAERFHDEGADAFLRPPYRSRYRIPDEV